MGQEVTLSDEINIIDAVIKMAQSRGEKHVIISIKTECINNVLEKLKNSKYTYRLIPKLEECKRKSIRELYEVVFNA